MIKPLIIEESSNAMNEPQSDHVAVMLNEVIEYLNPQPGGVFVDGTLGMGGHAKAILERIGPNGRLVAMDRDYESLEKAKTTLSSFTKQCHFIRDNFRHIDRVLNELKISEVDGILLDLGISSFQLDQSQRGFSIRLDGPLDMRMDQNARISAFDLINSLSEKELSMVLKDFGQERWHNRIARSIVWERSKQPIDTTKGLCDLVMKAMPKHRTREKIHPATRTFQAFRIAVNRELEALEVVMDKCVDFLKTGGRVAVISFHSLEDKIVKERFKLLGKTGSIKVIVKKPLRPTEDEIVVNPRARSARLRIAERI